MKERAADITRGTIDVEYVFVRAPVWVVFALARSRLFGASDVAAVDGCGRGIAR